MRASAHPDPRECVAWMARFSIAGEAEPDIRRHRPAGAAGQHHRGEDACIIDRPASPRWDWHMRAARLTMRALLWAGGPVGVVR
jgi:hypothetical protein